MKIIETNFDDLFEINFNNFNDNRGFFKETYNRNKLKDYTGNDFEFIQDNLVYSEKMVLRGLHYQQEPYSQTKYIYVIHGEILDVVVDIRKHSKTYGKYHSCIISSKKNNALIVPKGFAHGYLTLSDIAYVNYKVDNIYHKSSERGIKYDDRFLNIKWGHDKKLFKISEKDKNLKNYKW